MDFAASIQAVTEEVVLRMGRHIHARTGLKNLVLAGGVALNCVANGRLLREGPFQSVWIQPASGDAGGALGAALFVWYQLLKSPRSPGGCDAQKGSLLGPSFSPEEVHKFLVGEMFFRLFVHFIGHAAFDSRYCLGPCQGGPLPIAIERSVPPRADFVQPLLGFSQSTRIFGVHINTPSATVKSVRARKSASRQEDPPAQASATRAPATANLSDTAITPGGSILRRRG